MTKFTYAGPTETVELRTGTSKDGDVEVSVFQEFQLIDGRVVDLPDDNAVVAGMRARGMLTPVPPSTTARGKRAQTEGEGA